jgi:hypothetical protein
MEEAYKAWLEEADQKDTPTNRAAFKAGWDACLNAPTVVPDLNR